MSEELTLDKLVAAIREGHTLDYLRRMVGPGEEDQAAAEDRVYAMNACWERHGTQPIELWPWDEQRVYRRMEAEQIAFEAMYC